MDPAAAGFAADHVHAPLQEQMLYNAAYDLLEQSPARTFDLD
jgi:hypothetical protein